MWDLARANPKDIKNIVFDHEQIPIHMQLMYLNGKRLDEGLLSDYGVERGMTIRMVGCSDLASQSCHCVRCRRCLIGCNRAWGAGKLLRQLLGWTAGARRAGRGGIWASMGSAWVGGSAMPVRPREAKAARLYGAGKRGRADNQGGPKLERLEQLRDDIGTRWLRFDAVGVLPPAVQMANEALIAPTPSVSCIPIANATGSRSDRGIVMHLLAPAFRSPAFDTAILGPRVRFGMPLRMRSPMSMSAMRSRQFVFFQCVPRLASKSSFASHAGPCQAQVSKQAVAFMTANPEGVMTIALGTLGEEALTILSASTSNNNNGDSKLNHIMRALFQNAVDGIKRDETELVKARQMLRETAELLFVSHYANTGGMLNWEQFSADLVSAVKNVSRAAGARMGFAAAAAAAGAQPQLG